MKIIPERLEAMKRLHLPTILGEYGIQLKVAGRESFLGLCPFHEDKNPSLSVGKKGEKWLWHCFGCRASGNVIDFKMKRERIPFGDTYRQLLPRVNGGVIEDEGIYLKEPPMPPAPPAPAAFSLGAEKLLGRVAEIYHQAFCESKPAQDYLTGRGIKDGALARAFTVGFCDGRLRRMLPDDPAHEFRSGLRALGVLTERGGEFFQGCVTFPILDDNGVMVGMYGRRAVGQGPSHLYLPGPHRGVWNGAAVKAHREIILTESIIDALSLYALGFTNAVPIYGVNGLTDDHLRLMREHRTARARLCFDNDPAGAGARKGVREKLEALGVDVLDVFLPEAVKDVNEALQKGLTADGFRVMLSPAPVPVTAVAPATASATASATGPRVEEKDGAVFVDFGRRKYRVSGWSVRNREQSRMSVKVEDGETAHVDLFPLYSSSAREKFVSCCRKVMKADAGDIHRELNGLIEILEGLQAFALGGKEGEQERSMTAEEEAEALAALRRPSLLADILTDMEAMGYVGEEANKAIGYLVGVSRKLDDPLSCVIISQSSAGKSVLAETVEKLTPPEDVLMFSRITDQALYYMPKDAVHRKLLILEERAGGEGADYSIRTLQSKKRLTLAVTMKDEATGKMETKQREVEGPIAYIETTTRPRIHDENATRCFELYLDESPEQTQRIHVAQRRAKTLDGLKEKSRRDSIQRRHWNMHRLLKRVRVVIPYADLLEFPAAWLRTRRDHMRLLNLIEAISFLHQHQRPTEKTEDGQDYILATVEDYKAAYNLAAQVMGESLTELKKPQRKLLEAIQGMGGSSADGVTRREIREKVGLSDTRLRALLDDLVALEYLRQPEGGGHGRMCRYRLVDLVEGDDRRLIGLTTPEELSARFKARGGLADL